MNDATRCEQPGCGGGSTRLKVCPKCHKKICAYCLEDTHDCENEPDIKAGGMKGGIKSNE